MYKQNKSLNFGQYVPNDKVLNKKIPANPKYRNVKPAIDTGKNVRRHIDELKEKQLNVGYKKGEIFKRIRFSSFITLALHVAKLLLNPEDNTADYEAGDIEANSVDVKKENGQIANVLIGIGEIDLRNEKNKPPVPLPKAEYHVPYLLLDVRDRDAYIAGHLRTAKHYPSALLSRSIGYETEDMKQYKNSKDIIILYDEDEPIASRVATTLVQRGYENIFIIAGGLKGAAEILPRNLLNLLFTDKFPVYKSMGACGMVVLKTPSVEYFTQEDIDNIELYIEDIPIKDYNNPRSSSKTLSPCSKARSGSQYQKTGDKPDCASKHGSLTYRKDSAGSVKSTRQPQIRVPSGRPANSGLVTKRAPWK